MWQTIELNKKLHIFYIDSEVSSDADQPLTDEIRASMVSVWLSDFQQIWLDLLTLAEVLERSKLDNKLLDFDEQTVLTHVIRNAPSEFRQHPARVQLEPFGLHTEREDLLLLKFKTYESDTPYHFHWRMQRQGAEVFFAMVTKSLMVNMLHSQRKCAQLLDVIRRKDVEIEQYKLSGAQILRSHLATAAFDFPAFNQSQALHDDAFDQLLNNGDTAAISDVQTLSTFCELPAEKQLTAPKPEPSTTTSANHSPGNRKRTHAKHQLSPSQRRARQQRTQLKFPVKADVKMVYGGADSDSDGLESDPSTTAEKSDPHIAAPSAASGTSSTSRKVRTKLNL